jgi:T3SS negative regulator,GrlR
MHDGLYKVTFYTPRGTGTGVVTLLDGRVRGGNASNFYLGTYVSDGEHVSAQVTTRVHTRISGTVFLFGVESAHIRLSGSLRGSTGHFTGTAREAPGIQLRAVLEKLSD